jgi:uncharacterized membrane protein YjjP (DUF1212 family)
MPQQVKESQSMDQQYFKRKDTATAIGNYSAFQSFFTMLASSLAGLWYQFGADVTFIVTAFASILIGLYFIFMTTEKHNLNTYALITLLCHKPPPIKGIP